jgi:hypothetical protein
MKYRHDTLNDDGGILVINSTPHLCWETFLVSFPLQENYAKILASEELVSYSNEYHGTLKQWQSIHVNYVSIANTMKSK